MLRIVMSLVGIAARIVKLQTTMNFETPQHSPPPSSSQQPSNLAYIVLVCGIGAWVFLPFIGAIAGAFLGWIELGNIKKGQSPAAGETIAKIGFYLSLAQIVVSIGGACLFFAMYFGLWGLVIGLAATDGQLAE